MTEIALRLRKSMEVALGNVSRDCIQQQRQRRWWSLCSGTRATCTVRFQEQFVKLYNRYTEDLLTVAYKRNRMTVYELEAIQNWGWEFIYLFRKNLKITKEIMSTVPSTEPLKLENLIRPRLNLYIEELLQEHDVTKTREHSTWGIIRSNAGGVTHPCCLYRNRYTPESDRFQTFVRTCSFREMLQSALIVTLCVYKNETAKPLIWSTDPVAYFHSGCLCVALNGTKCGIKPPQGLDPHFYCLSVLLRDFQRQVWLRPSITYLDYAHMSSVPVCQVTYILMFGYQRMCGDNYTLDDTNINFILSLQCYFFGLVNKNLNCSEIMPINSYDASLLCSVHHFMDFVICDAADIASVPFYGPGDSALVQVLAFVEVVVRVLALTTYLACPQLRNLPGKVLIGYQLTALLRLVAVRCAEDSAPAVRLDVALDLASTLWLCAFLHFLTSSMRTLRTPDSLSAAEARAVLLRSALLGWALPAALSAAFFLLDDLLRLRVMLGQLLFLLCSYAALLANLVMFYYIYNYYRDLKKSTLAIRVGATSRGVFVDIFNFALKTSVLSGLGIVFRLIFTQIRGLETLLGYYHALGTLQALLFFLLYACNHKGRDFWRGALRRTFSLCRRGQNHSL